MYQSKLLSEVRMRKSKRSLALKLNILITVIVLTVSLVLVSISLHAYTKTADSQLYERLDRVDPEELGRDQSRLLSCVCLYELTRLDGFAEARAATLRENEPAVMREWMTTQQFHFLNGTHITTEEREARWQALSEEARQAGVGEYDWIKEHDPELTEYYEADFLYNVVDSNFVEDADQLGLFAIRIYAEDGEGYVTLAEVYNSPAAQDDGDLLRFGARLERVEAIEADRQRSRGEQYPHYKIDGRPEIARVLSLESRGVRLWFVYACDATALEQGRREFLLSSLLMTGGMMIAAIIVSLLILRHIAIRPLEKLSMAVDQFGVGDASMGEARFAELDIESQDEIGELYRNFLNMQNRIIENTESLTRMTAEKERISTELELAKNIQEDMLPNVFPPFPERKEFDLYAVMDPARAVGGDFYDFFLIDEDHLALVIADVSGKGIPGALFMMSSKLMLQNVTMNGLSPAKALEAVNRQIQLNNREEMFVTVWLGILEISTGRLTAANAGHEYPALMQRGGAFSLYKDKHGFVLGALDGLCYRDYELTLQPGEKLFVYTDGVPEATAADQRLFGIERMLLALNESRERTPREILACVREAVDAFVGEAEQFDDLTMLCLEYRGKEDTKHEGTDG